MCQTASVLNRKPKNMITRLAIQKRVANGETLVIIHNKVYNLTKWMSYHPGGELAIKHMAGLYNLI
jgi:delta8-fatty-acid desaturase